jgi:hypothetical protein
MPEFTVFWVDEQAGHAESISATSAEAAVAQVLAVHPGAFTNAVPAEF